MLDKSVTDPSAAIDRIEDGSSVMIGGFGESGSPIELIHALVDKNARHLTLISNNAGNGHVGIAALLENGQVDKIVCSFPRSSNAEVFTQLYRQNKIELELVPQGTLAERIRAGGSGIPGFYTATGVGTQMMEGKETKVFDGKTYQLELGLTADYSLVRCYKADYMGNLYYTKAARNFGPIMCMAANHSVVQTEILVDTGDIAPEDVHTPGIFVDKLVQVSNPLNETLLIADGISYP